MNIKHLALSASLIAAFIGYVIVINNESITDAKSDLRAFTLPFPENPLTPAITAPVPVPSTTGALYRDGVYEGDSIDAIYGLVQVAAVIRNGRISDIRFLQFPDDRPTSTNISNRSLPRLKSEAITIQSSEVDIVSGATQTSKGFKQSLKSALIKAKL